jgi:hypothetical protein
LLQQLFFTLSLANNHLFLLGILRNQAGIQKKYLRLSKLFAGVMLLEY